MNWLKSWWFKIGIAVIFSGGLLWWAIISVSQDTYRSGNSPIDSSVRSLLSTKAEQDGDNDGLKDWEEVLWNTSPSNPDTDKDGTPDGEEVSAGRNPVIAGPDDKFTENTINVIDVKGETEEGLTLTDKFSREFFASYFAQKKLGGVPSQTVQEQLVTSFLENSSPSFPIYTLSDVSVTSDNSFESLKKYGNGVGRAFRLTPLPRESSEPLQIVQDSLTNNDQRKLKEIDGISQNTYSILSALLKIPVPSSLVDRHLALVNSMSVLNENFIAMKNIFVDPLNAILHLQIYAKSSPTNMRQAMQKIAQYLESNGITYDSSEDGVVVMSTL